MIARNFAPREDDGHEISLKDGRRLSIATRSLHAEPGQLVLLTDLTETRRLQDQLSRHERLSALGRMVASLAHQIRTPLSAALLYASHLTEQVLPVEQQQRFAGRLKERLHELEHQVRDMLIFARGELPLPDRIAPGALFEALRAAAEPHVQGMQMRWQCDSREGELLCNRDTLVGSLLNLIENAIQAAGREAQALAREAIAEARRALREAGIGLSAVDPANAYGTVLAWPVHAARQRPVRRPRRQARRWRASAAGRSGRWRRTRRTRRRRTGRSGWGTGAALSSWSVGSSLRRRERAPGASRGT